MSRYSFEIIRRGFDRYSWVFVEVFEGRRRVLARADRDFRKKKQAKKAVCALRDAVADADIIDATGDDDSFDLPATSFEIAPYALPLVVGPPPIKRAATGGRRRARARRFADHEADEVSAVGAADSSAAAPAAAAAATAPLAAAPSPAAPTKAAAAAGAVPATRGRTAKKAGRGAAPGRSLPTAEGRRRRPVQ